MARVNRLYRRKGIFAYPEDVIKEIEDTLDDVVKVDLVQDFDEVVSGWESDVNFAGRKRLQSHKITVYIFPTGADKKVFTYVDKGTRPHTITGNPLLSFPFQGENISYDPKTSYRGNYGVGTGAKFGPIIAVASVDHPGNKGRDFSGKIGEDYEEDFEKEIRNAIRRGKRKARRF